MTHPDTPVWTAVALARQVRRKPLKIWFNNSPVVLFRSGGDVVALFDRCPHRFAELSGGRVVDGAIECPYHGWRFARRGACVAIPGHLGDLPTVRVKSFVTLERDGVIFLAPQTPSSDPYLHTMVGQPAVIRRVVSQTQSTLLDAVENILDATHTHYTHKGLLRGLSDKRYRVQVEITGGPGWVEACYTGEDKQQGVISKMLEGARTKTIGRFRYPGIAELEFWGPNGINLATTFHLRQSKPDTVDGIGWLAGPPQNGFGHVKAMFFKPLFNIALHQDRRILKSALSAAAIAPVSPPVIGPLDFLRTDIARILDGHLPKAATNPRRCFLEL